MFWSQRKEFATGNCLRIKVLIQPNVPKTLLHFLWKVQTSIVFLILKRLLKFKWLIFLLISYKNFEARMKSPRFWTTSRPGCSRLQKQTPILVRFPYAAAGFSNECTQKNDSLLSRLVYNQSPFCVLLMKAWNGSSKNRTRWTHCVPRKWKEKLGRIVSHFWCFDFFPAIWSLVFRESK